MSISIYKPGEYFDLDDFPWRDIFDGIGAVWEVLPGIGNYIMRKIKPNVTPLVKNGTLIKRKEILENGSIVNAGASLMDDNIQLGKDVVIEPGALVYGPVIIGDGTVIRQGAYIRGNVITGKNCIIGHSTEIKNSIMTGMSKAGHFAYIGDSVIGSVNLGAGTKLANFKMSGDEINLLAGEEKISTGLRKFGAILGDGVSTGCNSVTMPATVMGRNCVVYPNTTVRGVIKAGVIVKLKNITDQKERK